MGKKKGVENARTHQRQVVWLEGRFSGGTDRDSDWRDMSSPKQETLDYHITIKSCSMSLGFQAYLT